MSETVTIPINRGPPPACDHCLEEDAEPTEAIVTVVRGDNSKLHLCERHRQIAAQEDADDALES